MRASDPPTQLSARDYMLGQFLREIAFESFGVAISVRATDPRVWERLPGILPPLARPCDVEPIQHRFNVTSEDGTTFTVRYDIRDGIPQRLIDVASWVATRVDLPLALGLLESHLHSTVSYRAQDRVFMFGGAVAHRDRMILLPAMALMGTSTLVGALVRAGATYYSDQLIVLDHGGLVHPYPTPLHLPEVNGNGNQGVVVGQEPLPVGAIVLTNYRRGAEWQPRRPSPGESLLKLMTHAVQTQERTQEAVGVVRQILGQGPLIIESDRDEADALAPVLLAEVDRQLSAST